MAELLVIAFLGGFITGISPCIVPVLPVVMAGGSTGSNWKRPLLIVVGLVVSFSLTELLGSTVLSALHLPQNLLYWLGISLLLVLALGLLVPVLGERIERPFARLGASRYAKSGGGLVLGLSLGLVFVPCAGPVLAAISVAAANHRVNASSLFVTLFYSAGASLPLLVFASVAQRAATGWHRVREHLPAVRKVAGGVLAVTTLAIAFGWFDPLQRSVPGYTSALENHIESSSSIASRLQRLSGEHANRFVTTATLPTKSTKGAKSTKSTGGFQSVAPLAADLPELGLAPNFTGIVAWLNTPGDKPLTLQELRGKVVLIDFWTYSCINCQRSLPHVEAWYNAYKKDGLVVVGVHTPEFAFEHVVSNVRTAARSLGVDYPIAVDSNYGTWDAWNNEYWPAEYLIDPNGQVRYSDFGEGDYSVMEANIRALLTANGVKHLPPATDVANKTPTAQITPESYVGYAEEQYAAASIISNKAVDYKLPSDVPANEFALGGTWDDHSQEATAGSDASITINFVANDVYLVMGGSGTVGVTYKGRQIKTVDIGGIPKLYTLLSGSALQNGDLVLHFSSGVQAYDFTFG